MQFSGELSWGREGRSAGACLEVSPEWGPGWLSSGKAAVWEAMGGRGEAGGRPGCREGSCKSETTVQSLCPERPLPGS